MSAARTFKTRIDLPADRRQKLIALLNQHLADTFDLYKHIGTSRARSSTSCMSYSTTLPIRWKTKSMKSPREQRRSGARHWAPSAWLPGPRA
jgi:hypothetical protein